MSTDNPSPPVEPVEPAPPLSLEEIKAAISERHRNAEIRLKQLRADRDRINSQIRAATAERDEAARLYRALKPRASRKKPSPK